MTDHIRTEKIGGDSIFIFVVIQVERETVMTKAFGLGGVKLFWALNRVLDWSKIGLSV